MAGSDAVALLARVRVILVEPKSPGNVGSVARACANAGLGTLDLVCPVAWQSEAAYLREARRMARHASGLLEAARRYADLPSALHSASFVVGTSVRTSGPQRLQTPRSAAAEVLSRAREGEVALVFGREDRGLSSEELSRCDAKITIPSSDDYPAWNLSHAVAVVAAALREEAEGELLAHRPFPPSDLAPATHESLERLYGELETLLLRAGFLDPKNPERMMAELRRILGSRGLQERDARILLGVVHQLAWATDRSR